MAIFPVVVSVEFVASVGLEDENEEDNDDSDECEDDDEG